MYTIKVLGHGTGTETLNIGEQNFLNLQNINVFDINNDIGITPSCLFLLGSSMVLLRSRIDKGTGETNRLFIMYCWGKILSRPKLLEVSV